jgi:hypothetical protein
MQAMKKDKCSDSPTHFKHHHYAGTSVECQSHTSLHPAPSPHHQLYPSLLIEYWTGEVTAPNKKF